MALFPAYDPLQPKLLISPSILSADAAQLGHDVAYVSELCDSLHVDVMDGHFVPNISFGLPVLKDIKKHSQRPFDVHLMISNPDQYIAAFAEAGADLLTVHVETCPHLHRVVQEIRAHGMAVGVTLNPATPLSTLEEILPFVDLVLIMSVNPGFGGQTFIPTMLDKIRRLRQSLDQRELAVHIQVDGGVSLDNAPEIIAAGANVLVAGSAIFNSADPLATIRRFKACKP